MGDFRNLARGRAFRELVALQLQLSGFESARLPERRRLSETFADEHPVRSDILGIDGWHLEVRCDLQPSWSQSLDAAEQAASLAGAKHSALIEYRKDRPASEMFVVMSLGAWSRLALEAAS